MRKFILLPIFATMALGATAQDSTALYQNFNTTDSSVINGVMQHYPQGWYAYTVVGSQGWKWYDIYGVNNSPCIQFNDYVSGGDNQDEGWMITPKLNLSSYTGGVYLNYSLEYYFSGDSLHIMVSTNYSGTGSPDASGVTWTEITHSGCMFTDTSYNTDIFEEFQSDLTTFKSTPFYVGFKYTSTDSNGSRWDIDSVTTGTTPFGPIAGIAGVSQEKLSLSVIGRSTPDEIKLGFNVKPGTYKLEIYDIVGRKVHDEYIVAQAGDQTYTISNINLLNGMYIVKLENEESYGVTKVLIQ